MKTLLITGGSSGIGLAIVQLFARRGWQVIELSRHGVSHDGALHIPCDVTDEQHVQQAVAQALTWTDHLDVVIANAGFGISGTVEFTSTEDVHRQLNVNFFGALHLVKAVLPILRKQQGGTIIFSSSVAATLSVPYQAFYSASKAAINAMALALQNEVRAFGIHVSVLMPGDVATGFTAARSKDEKGRDIYPQAHKAVATMEHDEQHGMTPEYIAGHYWRIANKTNPAPQYIAGALYQLFCVLDRILPKRLVNWMEWKIYS